jgi:hypothetical protein
MIYLKCKNILLIQQYKNLYNFKKKNLKKKSEKKIDPKILNDILTVNTSSFWCKNYHHGFSCDSFRYHSELFVIAKHVSIGGYY